MWIPAGHPVYNMTYRFLDAIETTSDNVSRLITIHGRKNVHYSFWYYIVLNGKGFWSSNRKTRLSVPSNLLQRFSRARRALYVFKRASVWKQFRSAASVGKRGVFVALDLRRVIIKLMNAIKPLVCDQNRRSYRILLSFLTSCVFKHWFRQRATNYFWNISRPGSY